MSPFFEAVKTASPSVALTMSPDSNMITIQRVARGDMDKCTFVNEGKDFLFEEVRVWNSGAVREHLAQQMSLLETINCYMAVFFHL